MDSEWVKLKGADDKVIYANLANASSIFPDGEGSMIWFLGGAGEEGKIQVTERPEEVMSILTEIRSAKRP